MNNLNKVITLQVNDLTINVTWGDASIFAILHGDRHTALYDPGHKKSCEIYLNKLCSKITGKELKDYIKTYDDYVILHDTIINYYDTKYAESMHG